jgi:hypothetical protein
MFISFILNCKTDEINAISASARLIRASCLAPANAYDIIPVSTEMSTITTSSSTRVKAFRGDIAFIYFKSGGRNTNYS